MSTRPSARGLREEQLIPGEHPDLDGREDHERVLGGCLPDVLRETDAQTYAP